MINNINYRMNIVVAEIFQFKVTLRGFQPPIWRRLQIKSESSTFFDLHVAIQNAMGWIGGHNHRFYMNNPFTRIRDCIGLCNHVQPFANVLEANTCIDEYFTDRNRSCCYEYDLIDSWIHNIYLEKIFYANAFKKFPRCIAGKRACPLENTGGPWGYQYFLHCLFNPAHPNHSDSIDQLKRSFYGEIFDPEHFIASEIVFEDAFETWKDELEYEIGCKCFAKF